MYALRIREVIDPFLLGEGSYVPDMAADIEAELAEGCNCTIYTCWIYCKGRG